jgi:hypothetical protein
MPDLEILGITDRVVWALKKKNGIICALGNYLAPKIFSNRETARRAAREFRKHGIPVSPVRIRQRISVSLVQEARNAE